jgi:hypothetical protein
MGELEATITRRQADAEQLRAELDSLPPDADETTEALTGPPRIADGLADMPQAALRRLYDAIDLHIRYQPGDCSVPPGGDRPASL